MIRHHDYADEAAQAEALADAVAEALRATLAGGPARRATLAVSGGKSPRRFLSALSTRDLPWQRVDVTLVDDRWVSADDPDSNARLLRDTLLRNAAAHATVLPLVDLASQPAQRADALNRGERPAQPDVAVLGMGEDGHTASLFADAPEWQSAITTSARWVAVHPKAAPHARISLSLSALLAVEHLFLQIGGGEKRAVLARAEQAPGENAISKLIGQTGRDLHVYSFA
ncbi:6-phosphogluconolactonase [Chitinasiproducens palmae]|uniref:6-phosphogluconolactonase n=1 Tax=Chitinasiproducens palmae TaxID=1770053 RepID=A0A1H2PMD1_9BURK|nr:6-phosphogluconolactonase [Chitinasiproducens palmae]SDV47740.1 6-phosphogluconolactonase [Chitinasiproducens palmae]